MPDQEMELKLAQAQNTIAQHHRQGDYSRALQLSKDLFQQSQKHFGPDHPAVASALNNMGLMQKLLGDFVEARRHYNAALRIYAKVVGRDHASYAMTLHNLASLNKAQVHFDSSLKATERLTLVETALEYFAEALAIRQAELGDEHPLTIATRSSLGTTLADQVLHQHRQVQANSTTTATTDSSSPSQPQKYVSLNPEGVTQQGWKAAEACLRQALQTSIENPRGKSIHPKGSNHSQKKKKGKKSKPGPKVAPPAAAIQDNSSPSSPKIETLSAASAAQNLAVVLKSRAMTTQDADLVKELLEEAHDWYQQVLNVRLQLLSPVNHPEILACKFSLAELLQVQGKEEEANIIRQEILDDYHPTEAEEESSTTTAPKKVLVEQTKATSSATTSE